MIVLDDLARALWEGPLDDPAAPGRELAERIAGLDYPPALERLRALTGWRLPCGPALSVALARWPWSIDLALLAHDAAGDTAAQEAALAELAARVEAQQRRPAALARRLWAQGRASQAHAVLAKLDHAAPSALDDLACRCELALAEADWPAAERDLAALPAHAPQRPRLRALLAHGREGGAGLALLAQQAGPEDAALLPPLFELALAERDHALARDLAARISRQLGPESPAACEAAILLALDGEAPQKALDLLAADLPDQPWRYSARQHIRLLRARLMLSDQEAEPGRAAEMRAGLLAMAAGALRLHPAHELLRGLWLTCRERIEDWRDLEASLLAPFAPGESPLQRAAQLDRLGQHEAALTHAPFPEAGNPHWLFIARARRRAESALLGGDPDRARAELALTEGLEPGAPLRADLAYLRAELCLWEFDHEGAETALAPLDGPCPNRAGLWLQRARTAFLRGDFPGAEAALARFRRLKTAQLDSATPPAPDLRDRITEDASRAARALPRLDPRRPLRETLREVPPGRFCATPGLAAWALATGQRQNLWQFRPLPPGEAAAIPRRLIHYWEGPPSVAAQRTIDAWARHHPGLTRQLFDRAQAAEWLERQAPALLPLFERQQLPATRADLFRIAWLHREGGIYADFDELPRRPIDDWLQAAKAVFCIEVGYGTVANNFIACAPGLPLMARMLERIEANLAASPAPYPWWDSGPAPLSQSVLEALTAPDSEAAGLRILSQAEYCARISTNLPFPHKRSPLHWR